ncbi:class I adenylate-forming enzyme family protein [Haloferax sp. YSSS75]|uniref:class I adenylate-forming enzyme family protein n=1 Tax=Haloferax sp. YSSS75 TaxID=3388564 RepID=UPI00398CC9CB
MTRPDSTTLSALLDELVDVRGEQVALIDEERTCTYRELGERASLVAGGLARYGVGPGDRVAILMENRIEWVETMFAAMRLGATVVGVSTWAERRELRYFLEHSGANALVATASFAGKAFTGELEAILGYESQPAGSLDAEGVPDLDTVVLLGADRPGAVSFESLSEGTAHDVESDPNDPDDTALLLYTSGSTSRPKGVPLLHGGIVENAYHIGERMHLTPDDRFWLVSPLFWSYGSANALGAMLTHGASAVLQSQFDPEVAVELAAEHDCTVYYGMANMARRIVNADNFDSEQLSFRTGTTIGQPEDVAFTMDRLGVEGICNVYGSTETYGNCAVTDRTLPREVRLQTQGRPLPGQDIVITDPETGERLEQGEVGEIRVGGRITPGYHDAPEVNREAFDEDGYLKMGDLGRLDEHGRIQFRGRLKNVIKTGGINVSALEVEEFIRTHPSVEQAYVVGLEDEEKGEIVAAAVVPVDGASLTEAAVRDHCRELSAYKRPVKIAITTADSLPETDTGKIKRLAMTELFE